MVKGKQDVGARRPQVTGGNGHPLDRHTCHSCCHIAQQDAVPTVRCARTVVCMRDDQAELCLRAEAYAHFRYAFTCLGMPCKNRASQNPRASAPEGVVHEGGSLLMGQHIQRQ